jgi:hypothetical protein
VDFLERDQLARLAVAALEDLRSSVMLDMYIECTVMISSSAVQRSAVQCDV